MPYQKEEGAPKRMPPEFGKEIEAWDLNNLLVRCRYFSDSPNEEKQRFVQIVFNTINYRNFTAKYVMAHVIAALKYKPPKK